MTRRAVVLACTIAVLACAFAALAVWNRPSAEPRWGVTFSTKYTRQLGLSPDTVFWEVVNDLNVRAIRLPVYWDEVQPQYDTWNWNPYDHLIQMANEKGVALTLTIGAKAPRWPECHVPAWIGTLQAEESHAAMASYVAAVIERYNDQPSVERWQIENEPLFPFGECGVLNDVNLEERLDAELAQVRTLTKKPIQLTASGELEPWTPLALRADVLGVSLYRTTWNEIYGYFRYPIPALFYRIRAAVASRPVIISELQAEPWFPGSIASQPVSYWARLFTREDFRDQVRFARKTGLPEAYLWGVEWWYYLNQQEQGYPELWNEAKQLYGNP